MAALSKDPEWNAKLHTTCVTTLIPGGHATNALPQRATAIDNCRMLPSDDILDIQRQLTNALAEPRIEVGLVGRPRPSPASPLREDVLAVVERSTEAVWPGCPVVPTMENGATDGTYLRRAGIPMASAVSRLIGMTSAPTANLSAGNTAKVDQFFGGKDGVNDDLGPRLRHAVRTSRRSGGCNPFNRIGGVISGLFPG
jgi:hypothetical protein